MSGGKLSGCVYKMGEPIKTTYVTGFIDLPRLEANASRRPLETYMRVCDGLLSLDIDLVYFGDPAIGKLVEEKRAGMSKKTCVIPIAYEDLPYHKYHDEIAAAIRFNGVMGMRDCRRFTTPYIVTILSKLPFLREVARRNPFGATHFCWIDFGYFHLKEGYPHSFNCMDATLFEDIDRVWSRAGDRFKIQVLLNPAEVWGQQLETLLQRDHNILAGGIMGGNQAAINWAADKQEAIVREALARGMVANEEMILTAVFLRFPERFDINGAYYATILQNFATVRTAPDRALMFISIFAEREGMESLVVDVCWKLLAGYHCRWITLNAEQLADICRIYLRLVSEEKRSYVRKMCYLYGVLLNKEDEGGGIGPVEWVYFNEYDSLYNDIRKVAGPFCLADLIEEAEKTPGCVAFTTRGWLKHTVSSLHASGGYEPGHGIYLLSTLPASELTPP
jgi:hypothetical protein